MTTVKREDRDIIQALASQVAELAALPVQEEKRRLWRKLNGLAMERPMVMIDQVCWNEMNLDDELTLRCEEEACRQYESQLRQILYHWHHFPVDRVVEPFMVVPKAVVGMGFGIGSKDTVAVTDPTNSVVGHLYENQFETDADLEKILAPQISHDVAKTEQRLALAHELFDGILEVRLDGCFPFASLWDPISTWMSVEDALYALVDRPDFVHRMLTRMTDGYLSMLDQLEAQGLLSGPQTMIHCTGAYTDELPSADHESGEPRTQDIWGCGLAQMLGSVSPAMYKEFEVDYVRRIFERFGLVYYGCCEPLDSKMDEVRQIPNVRKISMSPWVNQARGAAEIGTDYVYSRKPSPALVATSRFDHDAVRRDLCETMEACSAHGCAVEFILKDISTVRYEPQRLTEWAAIAMDVVTHG
ncbi:MAG: hypothetical protein HQ523_08225 [Lentisphaerae bacterium]|nr:hypothetical protein [Lentisphaerota bacterium]